MIKLDYEIDASKLQKALRIAPGELRAEVADEIDHMSRSFLKRFRQTRFNGPPGVKIGGRGNLFSKFRKRVIGSSQGTLSMRIKSGTVISELNESPGSTEDFGIEIFSTSPVAAIHEFGGVINSAKGMLVPFSGLPARRLKGSRFETRFINGRIFLGEKNTKKLVAVFKNKIQIRPRLGFYKTWDSMKDMHIERLNRAIERAIEKI